MKAKSIKRQQTLLQTAKAQWEQQQAVEAEKTQRALRLAFYARQAR